MFKRRFIPYIVGICVVLLLCFSYVGYRAHQKHVEFKEFMSQSVVLDRSVDSLDDHQQHDHTHAHHAEGLSEPPSPNQMGDGETRYAPEEVAEWLHTGKMTPAVEETMRVAEEAREHYKEHVIQRVVTPDGTIHHVLAPSDSLYNEGDEIESDKLNTYLLQANRLRQEPGYNNWYIDADGNERVPPDEYRSIEDPYERFEYFSKFVYSIKNNVSMDEVENKVAEGELNFSVSEDEKHHVDQMAAMVEREKQLDHGIVFPVSDKPPVKVKPAANEHTRQRDVRSPYLRDEDTLTSGGVDTISGPSMKIRAVPQLAQMCRSLRQISPAWSSLHLPLQV